MEEAKLIRMATAISEYTISSMLRETASEAAEILNKAAPTARTLLCAPQQLLNDIAEAQKALEQLERSAVSYQKDSSVCHLEYIDHSETPLTLELSVLFDDFSLCIIHASFM